MLHPGLLSSLGNRWKKHLGNIHTRPAFCWLSATITVIVWHLPAVFEFALRSERWHEVEHACFFTTSILFWWPVVQPWPSIAKWPRWSIPLYLFLGVLANDALSAVLALWDRVLYPSYASTDDRLFNISPLDDQAFAGALMWVFERSCILLRQWSLHCTFSPRVKALLEREFVRTLSKAMSEARLCLECSPSISFICNSVQGGNQFSLRREAKHRSACCPERPLRFSNPTRGNEPN